MRVYELAKDLNVDSKAILNHLREQGVSVKSHMSTIDEDRAEEVREVFDGHGPAEKKPRDKTPSEPNSREAQEPAKSPDTDAAEKPAGEVVEQRVSKTVIRRRKKAAPPPEPAAEQKQEPEQQLEPRMKQEPQETAPPSGPAEQEEEHPPQEEHVPEAAKQAGEEAGAEKQEAQAPAQAEKPKIKKISTSEKEHTPARIIDRIDLGVKKQETPEAEEEHAGAPAEAEAGKPAKPEREADESDKKAFAKKKAKRKKFKWQEEFAEREEEEAEPVRHKRVRYKVKDKRSQKSKKQKAEVIPLSQKREPEKTVPKAIKRKIRVQESITVSELAKRMGVKATEVIKKLVGLGIMATINQPIDVDSAALVASDFGYEVESVSIEEEQLFEEQPREDDENREPRCPVVTVMGHVDHGKTSLLDAIRHTNVVQGEQGGITQHIGSYRVSTGHGDVAFVDTPGHEAFTTMRARGAQVTDIAVLVVAAEEGAKPQTIEAINHAKAAGVPIIVAVNKIDKPEANPERVRQEISQYGLVPEEWGGDTIFVDVSAVQQQGLDKLLEMIVLQAEMLELKANPRKPAKGTIIEAQLDRTRGPIATVLVQEGTLRQGDSFVSRQTFGKVRAMMDDRGEYVGEAGPSTPIAILGFSDVPEAGDLFIVVDEKKAKQTGQYWQQKKREEDLRKDARISLENFFSASAEQEKKNLRIIIKADVQGSVEALKQSLETLSTDEVEIRVIHSSVGAISLNDVMLASASDAVIIGFNVKTEPKVYDAAEKEKVDIRLYGVIYEIVDDVKKAMAGMLEPKYEEKTTGKAEVRQTFQISKLGTVAGCFINEGKIINGSHARVIRNGDVVHKGKITSLKRFKEDVKEAQSGQECGIFLGNYKEFEEGDIIESFVLEQVARTL